MCLLLIISSRLPMGRLARISCNSRDSRFGVFNFRLDRPKFPLGRLREFARNCLIWLAVFSAKTALFGQIRKNSQLRGKNREFGSGLVLDEALQQAIDFTRLFHMGQVSR